MLSVDERVLGIKCHKGIVKEFEKVYYLLSEA